MELRKLAEIKLPSAVRTIITRLERAGYEAYAVGGCVRDSILGRVPADWDITSSARPEELKALFDHTIDTGIMHGTVTVMIDHVGYEVTTYRLDGEYLDGRHPKDVQFTPSLIEDLKRRDFTINAMAYNESKGLVDAFGGMKDLEAGVIRCVGEPKRRFSEDALRMLRAVRFSAQLGFSIDEETAAAVRAMAANLSKVSAERIQVELVKTICSPHPENWIRAYELGLTAIFLPEFDRCMQTEQNTPHHFTDVGHHTLLVMQGVPADSYLRLAALLHDIAKPASRKRDENGVDHFKGHPQLGADIAAEILHRLRFDNETCRKVCALVRYHDERPGLDPRAIRRAIARIGLDAFPDLFTLKRADMLAQSSYQRQEKMHQIDVFEAIYRKSLQEQDALTIKQLKISGKDLLAMGIPQGRSIGETLQILLAEVIEEPSLNEEGFLRKRVSELAVKMAEKSLK